MEESQCKQQELVRLKEENETELEPSPAEEHIISVKSKEEAEAQYCLTVKCVKLEPECLKELSCSDIAKCEANETLPTPYTDMLIDELVKQSLCMESEVGEQTCPLTNMIKDELVLIPEYVNEECMSEAAVADLYTNHEVKDEVMLGPEHPHRLDVTLAVRSWALPDAGSWSATPAAVRIRLRQPKDCSVRLERLSNNAAMQTKDTTTHADTKPDNKKRYPSRQSLCGLCGEAFTLKADLIKHVMRHIHMPTIMEEEKRLLSDYEKLRSSIRDCWVKIERCDSAKTTVPSRAKESIRQLKIHTDETNHYICDFCCKTFIEKHSLVGHIKRHQERSHRNKKTVTNKLDIHENKRKRPYTCEICNKVFILHRELMRHERKHSGQKPYSCFICLKRFARMDHIKVHTETVHKNGEYKFPCEICQKKFKHLSHLRNHKLIHTDRKSYECNICNKQFKGLGNFKSHTLIHVERKHQCHICYKKFTHASCVERHQRVHDGLRPYPCKLCSKTFSLPHTLKAHLVTHTGQKPYECNICKKRFTQLSGLNSHTPIHAGVKRFTCEICSKSFMHASSCNRHKLTQHV